MAEHLTPDDLYIRAARSVEAEMVSDGVSLSPETAWNFLYRYSLEITANDQPRIVESNVLTQANWKRRSQRVHEWLGHNMVPGDMLTAAELRTRVDQAWKLAQSEGLSSSNRANVSGLALENGLAFLIEKFCGVRPLVKQSIRKFRGFELSRPAEVDELDLSLFRFDDFRIFISCVWTTRKDRLASDLYEAAFLRRRRPDVAIAFVVNEFHSNLLTHLRSVPEVDRIYHVCKDALLEAHRPLTRDGVAFEDPLASRESRTAFSTYLNLQREIYDLATLFEDINGIKPTT